MNYQESEVAGRTWCRFSNIDISNPRPGHPTVHCTEQTVIALDGREIIQNVGSLSFAFDQAVTFPLLNPMTNEVIGTGSGAQVMALVYSYVMAEAAKRDAEVARQAASLAQYQSQVAAHPAPPLIPAQPEAPPP